MVDKRIDWSRTELIVMSNKKHAEEKKESKEAGPKESNLDKEQKKEADEKEAASNKSAVVGATAVDEQAGVMSVLKAQQEEIQELKAMMKQLLKNQQGNSGDAK
jgi:hypothetical protein